MFDQSEHPVGHEAGGTDGRPPAGQLGDFDHSPTGSDIDPPAGPGGDHLVGTRAITSVNHNLYTITFHDCFNALTCGFLPAHALRPAG
jgi:hypothetical protein